MAGSQIARFREQQVLQEQSAQQGLDGLAMVSRHETIIARMEQGAQPILQLIQEGKKEEVITLLSTTEWC